MSLEHLKGLLNEVRGCFTRDDDLPNNLLDRIDEALDGPPDTSGAPACSICGLPQFNTFSGMTCTNGHGGADPA